MSQQHSPIQITVDTVADRLDQLLTKAISDLSRSQVQKLIRQGHVQLTLPEEPEAQTVTRPNLKIQPGTIVTIHLPTATTDQLQPEAVPLDIVYDDDALIVINKPAGMVVHPAQGHRTGTIVNALLAQYPDLITMADVDEAASDRPGIVHRLDRDTSGLMIVARTPAALQHLRQQFKARTVEKTYLALVFGRPEATEGIIDVPLGRDPHHRQKFAPRADGKSARTHYRLLEEFDKHSLLEIGLETGRTHQIRVHLAWLKCAVVGDTVYGRKKNKLGLKRQFLHAWRLKFEHPETGDEVALEAPLDTHLQVILNHLRR